MLTAGGLSEPASRSVGAAIPSNCPGWYTQPSSTLHSLGTVGPAGNYASLGDLQKWVCTAAMLLGRLELFTLVVVLNPRFWRP